MRKGRVETEGEEGGGVETRVEERGEEGEKGEVRKGW